MIVNATMNARISVSFLDNPEIVEMFQKEFYFKFKSSQTYKTSTLPQLMNEKKFFFEKISVLFLMKQLTVTIDIF